MKTNTAVIHLRETIIGLENKKAGQEQDLKLELAHITELLKPANLIKNSIKELVASPGLKTDIFDVAIGMAVGMLSKKIIGGGSTHILKSVVGNIAQMAFTRLAASHSGNLRNKVTDFVKEFLNKKEKT